MMVLKVLAFVFLVPGFMMVFAARWAVGKYSLDRNIKCDFENEMGPEETAQYKFNKAMVNFKLFGMLVALPGLVLVLIAFR